jgi:hypothetical protein
MPSASTAPDDVRGSRHCTSSPCRSFLCSRSQPKPRRNLCSRYTDMMESINPRSYRSGSSNRASFTTRRTRSSSTTSLTSLTNPTTSYQNSYNGRLGSTFSILKPFASRNQTLQVLLPKVILSHLGRKILSRIRCLRTSPCNISYLLRCP